MNAALQVAEELLKRCHSEEQQRRRISHGLENTQNEILRCAQDDSILGFFRSLSSLKMDETKLENQLKGHSAYLL